MVVVMGDVLLDFNFQISIFRKRYRAKKIDISSSQFRTQFLFHTSFFALLPPLATDKKVTVLLLFSSPLLFIPVADSPPSSPPPTVRLLPLPLS